MNVLDHLQAILSQETRMYSTQHAVVAQEADHAALELSHVSNPAGDASTLTAQQHNSQLAGQANGLSSLLSGAVTGATTTKNESQSVITSNQPNQYLSMPTFF